LEDFYKKVPGQSAPEAEAVEPIEIPQPYRGLLVHNNDMTSTLEHYHREGLAVRVLERVLSADWLARHIVLEGLQSGRPMEYGAIRINLGVLSEDVQRKVLQCRDPLGGILNEHGVQYGSCPGGFFRVQPTALMHRVLGLHGRSWMYGRCNCLSDLAGHTIAEVVEILPPDNHKRLDLS
jgi:hypothetical protein